MIYQNFKYVFRAIPKFLAMVGLYALQGISDSKIVSYIGLIGAFVLLIWIWNDFREAVEEL